MITLFCLRYSYRVRQQSPCTRALISVSIYTWHEILPNEWRIEHCAQQEYDARRQMRWKSAHNRTHLACIEVWAMRTLLTCELTVSLCAPISPKRRITHKSEKFIIIYCNLYTIRRLRQFFFYLMHSLCITSVLDSCTFLQFHRCMRCRVHWRIPSVCLFSAVQHSGLSCVWAQLKSLSKYAYELWQMCNVIQMRSARDQNKHTHSNRQRMRHTAIS